MMKNKITISKIIYVLLFLLPFILGAIFYSKLPDTMITHWNFNNEPDGYSSKPFALFGMPLILIGITALCLWITKADPKYDNVKRSKKVLNIVIWFMPILTNIIQIVSIIANMGKKVDIGLIVGGLIGILFIVIGNYLPKCKQNYTLGVRTPWTLASEKVWQKTHKLSGVCFVICGFILIITSILKSSIWGMFGIIVFVVLIFLPIVYSYILYKKEKDSH